MKNLALNTIVSMAIAVLLIACSPKKGEVKEEAEKMEAADIKNSEQPVAELKVFEGVDPSVKAQINSLLINYFKVTKSLINDDAEGARAAAKVFSDNLSKFDMSKLTGDQMTFYHTRAAGLSTALKRILESVDLDEIRTETSNVSDSMYAMVKAYGANSAEIYYNYCPMARNSQGAYWLSEIKEIENPYMGQMMPRCGSTKEVLK